VKTVLCIFALLLLTASTADAYVRRHPVASGTAVAAGTAAPPAYTVTPFNCRMDCDNYKKNLRASGYNPGKDYTAIGTMKVNITP
jgi:hypothetical protein